MSGPTKPISGLPGHAVPDTPDARMRGDQADRLRALCDEFDAEFDASLTQEQAEERIEYFLEKKRAA